MRKLHVFVISIFISQFISAQKFTIHGTVRDSLTGETLIGANILVSGTQQGVVTNNYGFYSLTLSEGEYNLSVSYIGYRTSEARVSLNQDINYNINLHRPKMSLIR